MKLAYIAYGIALLAVLGGLGVLMLVLGAGSVSPAAPRSDTGQATPAPGRKSASTAATRAIPGASKATDRNRDQRRADAVRRQQEAADADQREAAERLARQQRDLEDRQRADRFRAEDDAKLRERLDAEQKARLEEEERIQREDRGW